MLLWTIKIDKKKKVKNNNNKKPKQAYLSIPPSPSIIYFSSTHLSLSLYIYKISSLMLYMMGPLVSSIT